MNTYLQQLEENCRLHGDYIAFKSSARERGITYRQLWDFSGRLYTYLKSNGIGKEDRVLICLPRGIRALTSVIGILRSGAAFIVVESTYAKDRIEYIKKDCQPKLVIDEEIYTKAMSYSSREAYEIANPHDACFAVYTSGSTGNPKGVLHEYGKIKQILECGNHLCADLNGNIVIALPAPLNFVATVVLIISCTYLGFCLYIMPYTIVKDKNKLSKFFEDNKVVCSFLTPSLYRSLDSNNLPLKKILFGSEPCNGIYSDKHELVNCYASSESGFIIASFVIDKVYDITPAGKNGGGIEMLILDGNGNRLKDGEVGELCFFNEYTREYINLPEKTKETFVNGIYHTGDLAYINDDGQLVVQGRMDDMIKINGNRIEPAEIESAIRKILGISNVVSKGFVSLKRSFICAYLIKDELESFNLLNPDGNLNIPISKMNDLLSNILPYYMLPSYYIVLDSYPKNNNGKIVRKELEAPTINEYRAQYVAPKTTNEEILCKLYQKILNIDLVSVNDDFYSLGGDSIASVNFISECPLRGLTITDLYQYRTPKNLAEYFEDNIEDNDLDIEQKNIKALEHAQILLPEMHNIINLQEIAPESIMWNLTCFFKLQDGVDANKFAKAVDKVLKNHPSYNTHIEYDDYSTPIQKYRPDLYQNIEIIEISENEFASLKEELVKPFTLSDSLYYRKAIYKTKKALYFFLDNYHIITDGTSIAIVLKQICDCYNDDNYVLPPDLYYLAVREEDKKNRNGEYEEIHKYYKDFYQEYFVNHHANCSLKMDNESYVLSKSYTFESSISVNKASVNAIRGSLSENEFFIAACLLAMLKYNGDDAAFFQWIFHGRDSKEKTDMTGILFRSLPIACAYNEEMTLKEYFDDIVKQVRYMSAHSSLRISSVENRLDYSLFFLYQKNIFTLKNFPLAKEQIKVKVDETADSTIEMMVLDNDDEDNYYCTIEYDTVAYKHESIVKFFHYFDDALTILSKVEDQSSIKISSIIDMIE